MSLKKKLVIYREILDKFDGEELTLNEWKDRINHHLPKLKRISTAKTASILSSIGFSRRTKCVYISPQHTTVISFYKRGGTI